LEDITYRVVRTLNEVDVIAAEDTRNSIKLLNHFDIKTKMTSYHEYNKVDKAKYLVGLMQAGQNVALITDAGTPAISDPGEELVRQCHAAGVGVTSLPGACAAVTALTLSGRSTRRFAFEAFLPYDKKERANVLESLRDETRTMIIYEAPHHLKGTLAELYDVLGDRELTICKELTKKHERTWLTTLADATAHYESEDARGEYVLVIEGKTFAELKEDAVKKWEEMTIPEHMDVYLKQGMDKKSAMKQVAQDRGIRKRDVYAVMIDVR
jgi:16S rRNA (cytidine1402-2'-O)-methyltransferase